MDATSPDIERLLQALEASAYPALNELAKLGPEAERALPGLRRWLDGAGWEEGGAEDWDDQVLLRDGWAIYCRWASDEQLLEALEWPNSRAVVEAGRELWKRGRSTGVVGTYLLKVVEQGRWDLMAGQLLSEMGASVESLDSDLFGLLQSGRVGAARALGERHPAQVVKVARQLEGQEVALALLRAAGPGVIPALLECLLDGPGVWEQALLEYPMEQLRQHLPAALQLPLDVSGQLVGGLWGKQPLRLSQWALATSRENFCLAVRSCSSVEVQFLDGMSDKERAFLLAISNLEPDWKTLEAGFSNPDGLVVWCHLVAARRAGLFPELVASFDEICGHGDELVWREALQMMEPPSPSELLTRISKRDSRLVSLRSLVVKGDFGQRRQEVVDAVLEALQDEVAQEAPREPVLKVGITLLEESMGPARLHGHPLWPTLQSLTVRPEVSTDPAESIKLWAARIDSQSRPPFSKLLSFFFNGTVGTPEAITKRRYSGNCYELFGTTYVEETKVPVPGSWAILEELLYRIGMPRTWDIYAGFRNPPHRTLRWGVELCWEWGSRRWVFQSYEPMGMNLFADAVDFLTSGFVISGTFDFAFTTVESLYQQADEIRPILLGQCSLEERLSHLLKSTTSPQNAEVYAMGPSALNTLFKMHNRDSDSKFPWLHFAGISSRLLAYYPDPYLEADVFLAAMDKGWSPAEDDMHRLAVRLARHDERIKPALVKVLQRDRSLYAARALCHLIDAKELGDLLRPTWPSWSFNARGWVALVERYCPEELDPICREMLEAGECRTWMAKMLANSISNGQLSPELIALIREERAD